MSCAREAENPKKHIPHSTLAMTEATTSALEFYYIIQ